MDLSYLLTPFFAWLVTGIVKFLVNSVRAGRLAFDLIGYGGMPSNHSAIVSSMAMLVALKEGVHHPAFGVAVTLAFIVMLDASSLRKAVGRHAVAINRLRGDDPAQVPLRERMGHSPVEIGAGVIVGSVVSFGVSLVF